MDGWAQRFEYFDSLGNEYKQADFSFYKNEEIHSYVWYDTVKNGKGYNESIASIDSNFNTTGRLKKVQQRYLDSDLTEYYNSNGNIYKKHLYCEGLLYSFLEENNEFYAMRNDIPISYAEWTQTSKTHFGEAIMVFYDSKAKAQRHFKEIYNKEFK